MTSKISIGELNFSGSVARSIDLELTRIDNIDQTLITLKGLNFVEPVGSMSSANEILRSALFHFANSRIRMAKFNLILSG